MTEQLTFDAWDLWQTQVGYVTDKVESASAAVVRTSLRIARLDMRFGLSADIEVVPGE